MKRLVTLLLTAGMLVGAATGASAIDFKAKGQWIFGFGATDANFFKSADSGDAGDVFGAQQRVRLQVEAIASESLSGTVMFEIGDTTWGNNGSGGALGADQRIIELRGAYIDWIVPSTEVKVRMGIQPIAFPSVAGGAAILDDMTAGIVINAPITDMFGVTAVWARPYNDNWSNGTPSGDSSNYLDNMDIFALMLPVTGDGWKVTPWVSAVAIGQNVPAGGVMGYVVDGMFPRWMPGMVDNDLGYATAFYAGLPMAFTYDNFNFELDFNYGTVDYGSGRDASNRSVDYKRSGWLVKGLFEYKMDWGTPGLFAWYGSGDDSNARNGSEMMPVIDPAGNFTSFMGDGEWGWGLTNNGLAYDNMLTYAGTWGVGLQIKNLSFMEDLSHIIRIAYWNGTNSPDMIQGEALTAPGGSGSVTGNSWSYMYMTTKDHLVEINFDTTYQIYENLQAGLQLGYIVNGFNGGRDAWEGIYGKKNAYKASLLFNYSF